MNNNGYTKTFYEKRLDVNYLAAKHIMPLLIDAIHPTSIIDLGCGLGIFLKAAKEHMQGISVLGVDGDYISENDMLIDKGNFQAFNLEDKYEPQNRYDLAISFEVAEHLPESSAKTFVESLVNCSDIIAFSAAVPHQGGTHHINEQYPSYWYNLFLDYGYRGSDVLKKILWDKKEINSLRRQNIMLYVIENRYDEVISRFKDNVGRIIIDAIHPDFWEERQKRQKQIIDNLQMDVSIQKRIISNLLNRNREELKIIISNMSIFDMADNIDLVRFYISQWGGMELRILFEEYQYVIWGNGVDANKIRELLCCLGVENSFVFSGQKDTREKEKKNFLKSKSKNTKIIIGSRKYYYEIKNELEEDDRFRGIDVVN